MECKFITASLSFSIVLIVALSCSWAESKKESGKTLSAFPDVEKTPSPEGSVPIPYPNIGQSSDTAKGSKKVKSNLPFAKSDQLKISSGDEAGTAGGGISQSKKRGVAPMRSTSDICAKDLVQKFPSLKTKCDSKTP